MSQQRKTRTAFCKDDQDQLAAFLANHPGPRSGNALYQEFALINNSHTWQSWRQHYMKNSEIIDKIIRRIQKQKKEDCAKPGDLIRTDQKTKGKQRALAVETIEIDAGNEIPRKDQSKKRPASGSAEDFTLTRVQNEKHLKGVGLQSVLPGHSGSSTSSTEAQSTASGGLDLMAKDPGITMTSEEEQHFFEYLSRYPVGDVRLSMNLYEKYRRHAPRWSARQYQAYYLAHRYRFDGSSALHQHSHDQNSEVAKRNLGSSPRRNVVPNGVASPTANWPDTLRVESATSSHHDKFALLPDAGQPVNQEPGVQNAGLTRGSETLLPNAPLNAGQMVGPEAFLSHAGPVVGSQVSKQNGFLAIDTLSVSVASPDDLNLQYIPMSPGRFKAARGGSSSVDLLGSFSKSHENQIHHSDCETSTEEDVGGLRLLRQIRGHQHLIHALTHHGRPELNAVGIHSRSQVKEAKKEDRVRERGDKNKSENQTLDCLDQNGAVNAPRDQLDRNRAENQIPGQPNQSGAENQTLDQVDQNGARKDTLDKPSQNGIQDQPLPRPEQTRVPPNDRDPPVHNRGSTFPEGSRGTQTFLSALTSGPASSPDASGKSPLKSGLTSRTNSSRPAQDPTSIEEAIALVSEFLEDFGDLYTPRDALSLFERCGSWTLMFEVATLRKMELEGGDEVGQSYADMVQALVWTQEEDHLLMEFDRLSSTLSELSAEMRAKMSALESKKSRQGITNRREFLNGFFD